jgi:hypothetical protein
VAKFFGHAYRKVDYRWSGTRDRQTCLTASRGNLDRSKSMKFGHSVGVAMLAVLFLASGPLLAQEPSLHQVYQAVEAGRYAEAQRMMDQVLRDHPDSAKAHFVEAELLAAQGRGAAAGAELKTAERLAPGLPFASPQAVQALQSRIGTGQRRLAPETLLRAEPAQGSTGLPWGMLLAGLGAAAAAFLVFRAVTRRSVTPVAAVTPSGYSPAAPGTPWGGGGAASMTPAGGGLGSGILGGLATGAAVGAGMVAGEALMHRLTDGHRSVGIDPPMTSGAPLVTTTDLGGADFGIADSGSWDDASGGGSDWS